MKPMRVYRHMSCLDVDILVLKIRFESARNIVAKVSYYLRNGMALGQEETVTISKSDLWKWKRVE